MTGHLLVWGTGSSAGFAGTIQDLGEISEGAVEAPSDRSPGHMFLTDLPNSALAVL